MRWSGSFHVPVGRGYGAVGDGVSAASLARISAVAPSASSISEVKTATRQRDLHKRADCPSAYSRNVFQIEHGPRRG